MKNNHRKFEILMNPTLKMCIFLSETNKLRCSDQSVLRRAGLTFSGAPGNFRSGLPSARYSKWAKKEKRGKHKFLCNLTSILDKKHSKTQKSKLGCICPNGPNCHTRNRPWSIFKSFNIYKHFLPIYPSDFISFHGIFIHPNLFFSPQRLFDRLSFFNNDFNDS
jgi:hypothetical protein